MNATVVIVRPLGKDDNGSPIAGEPERLPIDHLGVAPRSSSDVDGRGRQGVIVGLTLYLAPDTDLRVNDQVEVNGELFEQEGVVGDWPSPYGWYPGGEVALRRADG